MEAKIWNHMYPWILLISFAGMWTAMNYDLSGFHLLVQDLKFLLSHISKKVNLSQASFADLHWI